MSANPVAIPSPAYTAMAERWKLIHDLRGGTAQMRKRSQEWLPREEAESEMSYRARVQRSFLYGALTDTITKLKSKPFSRPVDLAAVEELDEMLRLIEDDADNARCSVTQFASAMFEDALVHGLTHVMVDFAATSGAQTLADERFMALHPYFVHVRADQLIGWQYEVDPRNSKPILTQVRIRTSRTESDGEFGQREVAYIHVWSPTDVQVWRETEPEQFALVEVKPHTFGKIPLYTVYFKQTGFMTADPPLEDLAWLNLEHWQSSSEQRNVLHVARVPILYERGAVTSAGPDGKPRNGAVVISTSRARQTSRAPSEADLQWVEVGGKSIDAGANDLAKIEERMQVLGMQPLVEASAKTATEIGAGEARTHSSIKAWISALNDGLYEAYYMAAQWIGQELPEEFRVAIWDKFELEARSDSDMMHLLQMRASGDISQKRLLIEAKRRGKFGEDFDVEEELEESNESEMPGAPTEEEMDELRLVREGREDEDEQGAQPSEANTATATVAATGVAAADTALNGAQVQAAAAIVQQVALRQLPRDSGIAQLVEFFNVAPDRAERIMGAVGRSFFIEPEQVDGGA